MASPWSHVFTLERVAERWGVDVGQVSGLVHTRQIPQAFFFFGPARLLIPSSELGPRPHIDCAASPAQTRALISSFFEPPDPWIWPVAQILRVFEYSAGYGAGRLSLQQFRDYNRRRPLGWLLAFDATHTTVVGREQILVAAEDLARYEAKNEIHLPVAASQPRLRYSRDVRRHRCRAIAELLWHRDPQATLVDIYRHEWIQKIACNGTPPTEKTFREWVKDLNPNRTPGRRPR
jgi:hypothetical protein